MYKTDTDYPRLGPTLIGYMLRHTMGKAEGCNKYGKVHPALYVHTALILKDLFTTAD
jgi:hypothetical protein